MMQTEKLRTPFLLLALFGSIVLMSAIFLPFLKPLALAAVFAVMLQGVYRALARWLHGWSSIAALLTVLITALLVLVPLSVLGVMVGNEARSLYATLSTSDGQTMLADFSTQLNDRFGSVIPGLSEFTSEFSANVHTYTTQALQWLMGHAGNIFSGVSSFALSAFIFLIALYYLLRDGVRIRERISALTPLTEKEDKAVFDKLALAIDSVVRGNLLIALTQGILTSIGFTLLGVPNGVLWGLVASFAALVPSVGTTLVFVPAIAYMFFTGHTVQAVGLAVWGTFAVGLVDNMLGPKLIGNKMRLHPLLILLSVLGGIILFGPTGIFLGPLSLSLLFALLSVYAETSHVLEA